MSSGIVGYFSLGTFPSFCSRDSGHGHRRLVTNGDAASRGRPTTAEGFVVETGRMEMMARAMHQRNDESKKWVLVGIWPINDKHGIG
jgi:hypothetical protein